MCQGCKYPEWTEAGKNNPVQEIVNNDPIRNMYGAAVEETKEDNSSLYFMPELYK